MLVTLLSVVVAARPVAHLFPSLHDDSPLTGAEALSLGLPVLCLDHGGPPAVARRLGINAPADVADALGPSISTLSGLPPAVFRPAERPQPAISLRGSIRLGAGSSRPRVAP